MRIQDTDRILKDARQSRHAAAHQHDHDGTMTKMWRALSALPGRLFKK